MSEKLKRYTIGCTILSLVPLIVFLTGCGNDAYPDSFDAMKNVECESVDIKYDKPVAQEPEALPDSEQLDITEIYESVLNGEFTVEQEEEQVHISELFWGNDIEYCFWDIDGDGNEELHIRNGEAYYIIKVCDGIPQIFFEGWWGYEPVVTDGVCGILYYDYGYGSETIKLIKMNMDGSRESEGEFHWNDDNKNGSMDEEDSFKKDYSQEITMEQYVRYRDEQLAKQGENELEWTKRQLKSFATWQEAYIDFMNKPESTIWLNGNDAEEYSLIYVDDDNVPELYIHTGGMATGAFVVSYYDGKVRALNRVRGGIKYMEYSGLFYSDWGNTGFYPCNVYMLEKGEFSEIGTGWICENYDAEKEYLDYDYFWEGSLMTEAEYKECLNKVIDTSKCVEPSMLYTRDEIMEILEESLVFDGTDAQFGPAKTEEAVTEEQHKMTLHGRVLLEKPIVKLNGEGGELRYDWFTNITQVDEETFLMVSDCYFPEKKLQQRVFYLAQAPKFVPQEVFRQDSCLFGEESSGRPELLEMRMPCPKSVEGGYVYEADGLLYYLDEEFQESVLLCNLRELMGECYLFSPWTTDKNMCDVSADASKLLACTDEGLYEYNLESKEARLLESAVFVSHEIEHVEGDCDCGETGFEFDGPVEAEYVPGGQGYAFMTGTEYGNPTGVILRSAEGETLYQREIKEYVGGFRWIESEDAVYLAVFYREDGSIWMERVDVHTGEKEVFTVPDEVFWDNNLCVGFLDADHLVYCSKQVSETRERDHTSKSRYDIYPLSDEEIKKPVNAEEVNQQIIVLNLGGYSKIVVKYQNK